MEKRKMIKKKPETFEWSYYDKTELTLIQYLEKAEEYLEVANQSILESEGDPTFSDWRKLQKGMYAVSRLIRELKEREKK
jgi:hypothetical protein